jgi:DNA-binding transcriptional LysR family regulator
MASSMVDNLENGDCLQQQNWIGWTDKQRRPIGKVAKEYARFESKHKIVSAVLQMQACKNGMGVAILPCFMADKDPELMRIPPYTTEHKTDLWILSHPDLRNNLKIQTFVRFITERAMEKRALIEGELFELMPL